MKTLKLAVAVLALSALGACATDNTPKVKLSGAEIQKTIVGNTLERNFMAGPNSITSQNYYDPAGVMVSQNSKGETGAANWSIKGDELCLKWTKKGFDWVVSDSCNTMFKAGEKRLESNTGTLWTIRDGNPANLKP